MFTNTDTGTLKSDVMVIPVIKQRPKAKYLFLLSKNGMVYSSLK
jgi:hypothetical protein